MAETKKEKKKLGLSTKILISLLAGAITGVLIHYVMPDSSFKSDILINGILYVLGNGFIRWCSVRWCAEVWQSEIQRHWEK